MKAQRSFFDFSGVFAFFPHILFILFYLNRMGKMNRMDRIDFSETLPILYIFHILFNLFSTKFKQTISSYNYSFINSKMFYQIFSYLYFNFK